MFLKDGDAWLVQMLFSKLIRDNKSSATILTKIKLFAAAHSDGPDPDSYILYQVSSVQASRIKVPITRTLSKWQCLLTFRNAPNDVLFSKNSLIVLHSLPMIRFQSVFLP